MATVENGIVKGGVFDGLRYSNSLHEQACNLLGWAEDHMEDPLGQELANLWTAYLESIYQNDGYARAMVAHLDRDLDKGADSAGVSIVLRKHTATVSWPNGTGGHTAGHLTVQTEDPLAENQEARDLAERDLQTLTRLLEAGGIKTAISEAR